MGPHLRFAPVDIAPVAYPEFVQLSLLLENLPVSLHQLALQTPHLGFQQRVFVH